MVQGNVSDGGVTDSAAMDGFVSRWRLTLSLRDVVSKQSDPGIPILEDLPQRPRFPRELS